MSVADRLVEHWRRHGLRIRAGNATNAIAAFEQHHSVELPADFREYLQRVDGTGSDLDGDLFCFWPLERVVPVADELPAHFADRVLFPGCFVFADWSIDALEFAIQLSPGRDIGQVFLVAMDGHRGAAIAPSFSGFVDAYLNDQDRLFPNEPKRP